MTSQKEERLQNAIQALLPAVKVANELRALGIRVVGEQEVIAELIKLANQENKEAAVVVGNMFPADHAEITKPVKAALLRQSAYK